MARGAGERALASSEKYALEHVLAPPGVFIVATEAPVIATVLRRDGTYSELAVVGGAGLYESAPWATCESAVAARKPGRNGGIRTHWRERVSKDASGYPDRKAQMLWWRP